MIAFAFRFPAGRYHATPWGRNVNEADVAWPPEPVRILRALIATWWRKADHEAFPKALLDDLIDSLASELPLYRLPEAVHTHIRTFMPAPRKPPGTLIYDAFFRLDRNAEVVAVWPTVQLAPEQRDLATHLLARLGYLGRAESWVEAGIVDSVDGEIDAAPRSLAGRDIIKSDGEVLRPSSLASVPVDVMSPVTPQEWAELRDRLIHEAHEHSGKGAKHARALIDTTLLQRLADAISVDTSVWQDFGWTSPPPLRKVVYDRPAVGPLPTHRLARPARRADGQPGTPEVARFVLAGRPQPRVEETLRIAEIARAALMAKLRGDDGPPREISGRDDDGPLRDDPEHAHAFYLPEDADGDGLIDHLVVYCRLGFSAGAKRALDRLARLWIEHGRVDEEGERGRKEWRLALEDIGRPADFARVSPLLRPSRRWRSVTPCLKSRFDRKRPRSFDALVESYRGQILDEWSKRFPDAPPPATVEPMTDRERASRFVRPVAGSRVLSTLAFARARRGRGGRQPDTAGGFFEIAFADPAPGPIALGWGAHFGLGLFEAVKERSAP